MAYRFAKLTIVLLLCAGTALTSQVSKPAQSAPQKPQLAPAYPEWGEVPSSQSALAGITISSELIERFYAAQSPIEDTKLMSELVGFGADGYDALLEQAERADSEQLRAILALGVYISRQGALEYGRNGLDLVLEKALWPRAQQEWFPLLRELFELNGGGGPSRNTLLSLALSCAGEGDGAWFAERFPTKQPSPLVMQHGPGDLPRPRDSSPELSFAETTTGEGWRIAVSRSNRFGGSSFQLVLGLDADNDGLYEELYPTGLEHLSGFIWAPPAKIVVLEQPLGLLEIEVKDGTIIIRHQDAAVSGQRAWDPESMVYKSSIVSLEKLREDADTDGLSDIAEGLLRTEAANRDSDGDGLADGVDPCPLSNPALTGPVERGVNRAIELECGGLGSSVVTYVAYDGCRAVDYSCGSGHAWIWVEAGNREQAKQTYSSLRDHEAFFVDVIARKQFIQDESIMLGSYSREDLPANCMYYVDISGTGSGSMVLLCEVDGELYPLVHEMTWIS